MTHITTGLYKSATDAQHAIELLKESGISSDDIALMSNENLDKGGFFDEPHSKAPEGIAIGAAGGGTAGAVMAGIGAAASIATGGASLGLLVVGPVAAAIAGAGAGAAAGSVIGGMVGAAIPEHEVEYYQSAIDRGSVLVGVKTEDSEHRKAAQKALKTAGAEKVTG